MYIFWLKFALAYTCKDKAYRALPVFSKLEKNLLLRIVYLKEGLEELIDLKLY